jgi:hypothetical protein
MVLILSQENEHLMNRGKELKKLRVIYKRITTGRLGA